MKVYQLVHKDYKGDVVFGLPFPYNQNAGEKKINYLFSKNKPWKHCIPYYKNSKFAFISADALISFLFLKETISSDEYKDICDNFYIKSFNLVTWSSGLSKFLCTYFEDEIEENTECEYDIDTVRNWEAKLIYQDPVPAEDIKNTREEYYSNIKTYY